jgi:hypothetical protein
MSLNPFRVKPVGVAEWGSWEVAEGNYGALSREQALVEDVWKVKP